MKSVSREGRGSGESRVAEVVLLFFPKRRILLAFMLAFYKVFSQETVNSLSDIAYLIYKYIRNTSSSRVVIFHII